MKRYIVWVDEPPSEEGDGGWRVVESFDDIEDADAYVEGLPLNVLAYVDDHMKDLWYD